MRFKYGMRSILRLITLESSVIVGDDERNKIYEWFIVQNIFGRGRYIQETRIFFDMQVWNVTVTGICKNRHSLLCFNQCYLQKRSCFCADVCKKNLPENCLLLRSTVKLAAQLFLISWLWSPTCVHFSAPPKHMLKYRKRKLIPSRVLSLMCRVHYLLQFRRKKLKGT